MANHPLEGRVVRRLSDNALGICVAVENDVAHLCILQKQGAPYPAAAKLEDVGPNYVPPSVEDEPTQP
jgi:hypothetical protein